MHILNSEILSVPNFMLHVLLVYLMILVTK